MTPTQLRIQAETDQAREQLADSVANIQVHSPGFLLGVYDAIEAEADLADLPPGTPVQLPVLTFRLIAQLAMIGLADIDGVLKRRKEEA